MPSCLFDVELDVKLLPDLLTGIQGHRNLLIDDQMRTRFDWTATNGIWVQHLNHTWTSRPCTCQGIFQASNMASDILTRSGVQRDSTRTSIGHAVHADRRSLTRYCFHWDHAGPSAGCLRAMMSTSWSYYRCIENSRCS